LEQPELISIEAQTFRSLVECYTRPFMRGKRGKGSYVNFDKTLSLDAATATLHHPDLLDRLPPLTAVNSVSLPSKRADGSIELLPTGYDVQSGILTHSS
jgi:hypothetical protein